MKTSAFIIACLTIGLGSLAVANPVVLQGKVMRATGYLARAGWTDCQVKVSSQSQQGLVVDFTLQNAESGTQLLLPHLLLSKAGRRGLLEKMSYDFGMRTTPQPIKGSSIIPQASVQYSNLIKIKNSGSVIEYYLSELRSNGEFYGATSELVCEAH